MKMLSLFAAAAGMTLLGASSPPRLNGPDAYGAGYRGGYPPCSASVTDRCIQLYERGVASRRNLARNEHLGQGRLARMGPFRGAMPPIGPIRDPGIVTMRPIVVASNDYYPRCAGAVVDRCIQARAAAPAQRAWREDAREMVRIGERG
jgi:hypothetical protein